MEEPVGAQYAVYIAMTTMKDRCKKLQRRVADLEEENLSLRVQCSRNQDRSVSDTEVTHLRELLTKFVEKYQQVSNKMKMVTAENRELWNKLSKQTHVSENLGTQLNKINDSLVQYSEDKEKHSPLVRSRTFTQEEPHTMILQKNLEENSKICAKLDEISLEILNSFAQGKNELDSLYSELTEVQYNENVISDSCGFYYEDIDSNYLEEFNTLIEDLTNTKETVIKQKELLQMAFKKILNLQENFNKLDCNIRARHGVTKEMLDKTTSACSDDFPSERSDNSIPKESQVSFSELGKMCPVCSKMFYTGFDELQLHVESHFTAETYEFL